MEGESSTCTYDELENILLNGSSRPCSLPLEYLRRITNNFSDERLLGEGGFGKVYKGVLQNGKVVAVKRLDQLLNPGVQERQFENEVYHLMRLKHPNIVQFLGYCYETRNECVEHDGKYIFAEMQQKLICLEYLPNGSLDRHLSDGSSGHEWHTCYKIIKGICCGLLYLHEECQRQFGASIIHLDLKPGNILLDEYMGPKIADFGISRLFEDNKTQTCATFLSGSLGYMAPEYLIRRIVTAKADIYNLGVIITEIITGTKVDILSFSSPTSCQKFVDDAINDWRNRLGASETDCKQIECCLEIGLSCIKFNREERPTSREIIERLDRWETTNCTVNNEKRPPADQILTHMEEKALVSTTGYESIFCAPQPNITGVRVRSTGDADNNGKTNTGAGQRPYGSLNESPLCGFFHRQLFRVLRFLTHQLSWVLQPWRRRASERIRCMESLDTDDDDDVYLVASGSYSSDSQLDHVIDDDNDANDDDDLLVLQELRSSIMVRTFARMEAATKGSFGTLYRRSGPDGRQVLKRADMSLTGPRDDCRFQESEFLSRFRHKHLVGYCEYMKNGALYYHLHPNSEPSESSPSLVMSSWKLRIRILLDASRGIEYLHSCGVHVLDIKSSNILLDASWRARVSGIGVKVTGTVGYMDPEYNRLHQHTEKSDVYGFGVVMLEVLTGKRAILEEAEGASPMSVVDYAVPSIVSGELGKVLDPRVPEPDAHEAEALGLAAYIAVHCVRLQGKDRPAMAGIVANLQTAFDLCESSLWRSRQKPDQRQPPLAVLTPIDQD